MPSLLLLCAADPACSAAMVANMLTASPLTLTQASSLACSLSDAPQRP